MITDEACIHAAPAQRGSDPTSTRPAPDHVNDALPQLRQPKSLTGFWQLPFELQQRILAAACGPPTLHRWTLAGRPTDCTTTMLRLLVAAKVFHPLVTPLLYRHVRLTRPSALHAFLHTLLARPSLGDLVRSLHLGEDEEIAVDWWPLRPSGLTGSDQKVLRLYLGGCDEMPWRGCSTLDLDTEDFDEDPAKADALDHAFQTATSYLNVSLDGPRNGALPHDRNCAWCVGIIELAAAMELYYLELRRCEARAEQSAEQRAVGGKRRRSSRSYGQKTQPVYPRLRMGSGPMAPPGAQDFDRGFFDIQSPQILHRLASRGSPTDAFNHPLFFARSQASWATDGFDGAAFPPEDDQPPEGNEAGYAHALSSTSDYLTASK